MFNLKRATRKITNAFEPQKDPQVLIAEIHNEFDTATERLLAEAKEIISNEDKLKTDKAERLKRLGFSQSKTVTETAEQIKAAKESRKIADLIVYYQTYYPNNKFITEPEVQKICNKYGLYCANVGYYKGEVPEKNLKEIEAFSLRDEEKIKRDTSMDEYDRQIQMRLMQSQRNFGQLGQPNWVNQLNQLNQPSYNQQPKERTAYFTKPEFQICAPIKDFDTRLLNVKDGYRLEQHIPDPIVLQPVKGGYLIVSKWGLEANDEIVINEKMN